jgi:(+)-pinoresinol hydroxylase
MMSLALAVGILLPGAAMAQSAEPDLKAGKATFVKWCAPCHGEGIYMTGTNALRAKYKDAKPALLEQRTDLTPEIVKGFVRKGSGVMAPFRKTEITDAELDALAAYLSRKDPR